MSSLLRTVLVALLIMAAAAPAASAAPSTVGASGAGDPYFPFAGNGGIDVRDYSLKLAYDPGTRRLEGTATLTIAATQDLSRFDLDLRGFELGTVTVNGAPATTGREKPQELVISPRGLTTGHRVHRRGALLRGARRP